MKPPKRNHYYNEGLNEIVPDYDKYALYNIEKDNQFKDNKPRYCKHMMNIVNEFRKPENNILRMSEGSILECMDCMVYIHMGEFIDRFFSLPYEGKK